MAFNRSADGQTRALPPTRCEGRGAEPQLQPDSIWSKTKRSDQAETGALLIIPDSRASSRRLTSSMMPSWKLTFFDKWTLEYEERNDVSILSLSFLHRMQKKEDITTHQRCEILRARSLQEEQISPQSFTLFIKGKEAQVSTVQNFKFPRRREICF